MPAVWVALGALLGLAAGSFIATLVIRWPAGRSVVHGRSACDACAARLGLRDLIPLASYVAARGRCRACGRAIDRLHPAIEAVAAGIGATALAVAPGWAGLVGAVFGWMLLALAALDYRHFWLPDRLTLPLAALGLAVGATGIGPSLATRAIGMITGWLALRLVALVYSQLRRRDGLGGGDPKLLGALGAWLGAAALPWVVLLAALGGLAVVAIRAVSGRPVAATDRLPFGTFLAAAGFIVWLT